jgi:signal peptidase I
MEKNGHLTNTAPVVPDWVHDFTAYNTAIDLSRPSAENGLGLHWVGDLALKFAIQTESVSGEIVVELVKGGARFQCHIDLATGKATLAIVSPRAPANFHPSATTSIKGVGKHDLIFSNVDDELRLWVDNSVVNFDTATTYDSNELGTHVPTRLDWQPAGIAGNKAKLTVRHIKLMRDIYYIAEDKNTVREASDPYLPGDRAARKMAPLEDFSTNPNLTQPDQWSEEFSPNNMRHVQFTMQPPDKSHPELDQFFVLGDNSAQSSDARLWVGQNYVERNLLIGKALFIYWPHSWHKIPYTPIPFPFFPNFSRMHLVR